MFQLQAQPYRRPRKKNRPQGVPFSPWDKVPEGRMRVRSTPVFEVRSGAGAFTPSRARVALFLARANAHPASGLPRRTAGPPPA